MDQGPLLLLQQKTSSRMNDVNAQKSRKSASISENEYSFPFVWIFFVLNKQGIVFIYLFIYSNW